MFLKFQIQCRIFYFFIFFFFKIRVSVIKSIASVPIILVQSFSHNLTNKNPFIYIPEKNLLRWSLYQSLWFFNKYLCELKLLVTRLQEAELEKVQAAGISRAKLRALGMRAQIRWCAPAVAVSPGRRWRQLLIRFIASACVCVCVRIEANAGLKSIYLGRRDMAERLIKIPFCGSNGEKRARYISGRAKGFPHPLIKRGFCSQCAF